MRVLPTSDLDVRALLRTMDTIKTKTNIEAESEGLLSQKQMNRRTFIKKSAMAGLTGLAAAAGVQEVLAGQSGKQKTASAATANEEDNLQQFAKFKFNPDGKFKILHLTDTHYVSGDPRSERALKNVIEMLDSEKPDLVIHTGDIIFGRPAEESLREILAPISERKIPFAVTLGNHDQEFGMSRREVYDLVRTLPYNVNSLVEGIYGVSNDLITLTSAQDDSVKWVFYLFDSNHMSRLPGIQGYDYIHFDQIDWYRKRSAQFKQLNGGTPIPSLAFFHIPLPEYNYATRLDTRRVMRGNFGEEPYSPLVNSGLFVSMKEMGDVKAIICGHDHDNDYAMSWNNMFLMFGRFGGCDTVYNDLKPSGARVIELTEGRDGFRSWIRVYGEGVTQDLEFPEDFKTIL